jgi:hypothetical protein
MEFNSTVDFVKTFSHAKVDMKTVNGSDVQTTSISFTVEGKEAIQGHDTIKVNMTIESGSSSSYEIWIGESDGVVYRLQMEGQTYEYPMSSQIGSGLLGVFNIFVAYSQSLGSIQYQITGNTIVGFTEGWAIVSSEYTTWAIGGKTFPAWHIKVSNVAHPEVDMQSMEVTLANLLADRWFYVNIFFQAKNGMTFEETISELTLST